MIAPAEYAGVPVGELAELVGGITKDNGVTILAKDGYGMTLSYDQIWTTTSPPSTRRPARKSRPTASSPSSSPTSATASRSTRRRGPAAARRRPGHPGQVVDGHWTVKWVDEV